MHNTDSTTHGQKQYGPTTPKKWMVCAQNIAADVHRTAEQKRQRNAPLAHGTHSWANASTRAQQRAPQPALKENSQQRNANV